MEFIIRIALMFFFIQFLVVVVFMTLAMLLAQPGVPVLGVGPGRGAISRTFAWVIHRPSQVLRSVLRWVHHLRFVHRVH